VLLDARAALEERAVDEGLSIAVEVAVGERVQADRQALVTVVRNLFRNAIEHAAPATLRVTGDHRAVVFSDDGPGIPVARLARVLEAPSRRGRIDEASTHGGRVRGLGLAIAKRLCDLQGWQLAVRSPLADGRGTAFTLVFDAAAAV